ncbi:hypothetical protein [Paenibacillus sp. RU5M]|nr:hypothetical protein [Paenibacillus sp. RU5M]
MLFNVKNSSLFGTIGPTSSKGLLPKEKFIVPAGGAAKRQIVLAILNPS